jgi:transcription elongation factor GreA
MIQNEKFITKEGLKKLKEELENLKNVKRHEVAARIQEAKELGDLSENAEYAAAKDEQAQMESRILELENMIKSAKIIESENSGADQVSVGSTVIVESNGGRKEYQIVGSNEADPTSGKISNESPIGQAFVGKRLGEVVEIQVPDGRVEYRIVEIQ